MKKSVDFIIVSYNKIDYARLCVESINRYWKSVEHTVYIVVNYVDKEIEMKAHYDLFGKQENIVILEGEDQSSTTIVGKDGEFMQHTTRVGLVDQCEIASGSWYGAWATNTGIKRGNREYVCVLDQDTVFLDSYVTELIKLLDEYKFIGNRWCPGSIFKKSIQKGTCDGSWEDGIVRPMLFLCKRELYNEIELEKYVEKDIWRSSPWNCDYRDMTGNMTWYAKQKGYNWLVLKNSYRDGIQNDGLHRNYNDLWKEHLLDIPYGEQAWLDDTPIFFHATRGGYRGNTALNLWVREVEKYFNV